ncbi:MAG: M48 family metallopeptidase [Candidatus Jordarchaeum sp.]|uniref:M48 family metallopeptidase n=1 Tax=Candidatus Jordarchaeum sp. TaxID=2823881 RepID=UPI0040496D19
MTGRCDLQSVVEYTIDTELVPANLRFLPEFLQKYYLSRYKSYRNFKEIQSYTEDGKNYLTYKVFIPKTGEYIEVTVEATVPIKLIMRSSSPDIPKSFQDELYEDTLLMVQVFEEQMANMSLYFAYIQGEKMVPESPKANRWVDILFSRSMYGIFFIFIALSYVFLIVFQNYGPLLLGIVLLLFALFSGRLAARGDWVVTKDRPEVILLQYSLTMEEYERFLKTNVKKIPEIREKIYNDIVSARKKVTCELAEKIFVDYGIDCQPDRLSVKTVNVWQLVKKAAERFKLSMPKIVVANTEVANAAAMGPSPRLGAMIITTGIMQQLEEEELIGVIGHELSHLKNHDPIVLFGLIILEFILRFYIFAPYIVGLGYTGFFVYLIAFLALIIALGKVFEARCDLDAVKYIGKPKSLAQGLKKIAYKRLLPVYKREPFYRRYRRLEWLAFDPHPPAYYRINRIENLSPPITKHTFWASLRDNIKGFLKP